MNKLFFAVCFFMLINMESNNMDYNIMWRNASLKSVRYQMNKELLKDKKLEFTFKEIIEIINNESGPDIYLNTRKNFVDFWLKETLQKAKKTDTFYVFEMEKSGERVHILKYVEIKSDNKSTYYCFDKNSDSWSVKKSKIINTSIISDLFKLNVTKLKADLKNNSFDKNISFDPNSFKIVTRFCNNEIISKVFIYPDTRINKKIDIITKSIP